MKRTASAAWSGTLAAGNGTMSTGSGALAELPFSFKTRFEDAPGTNPEELIGAAHASCYAMALSLFLGQAGMTADEISASAAVTIKPDGGGFTITDIHLTVRAKIPGAEEATFLEAAEGAKANCPVSKVLNATITMDAALEA